MRNLKKILILMCTVWYFVLVLTNISDLLYSFVLMGILIYAMLNLLTLKLNEPIFIEVIYILDVSTIYLACNMYSSKLYSVLTEEIGWAMVTSLGLYVFFELFSFAKWFERYKESAKS